MSDPTIVLLDLLQIPSLDRNKGIKILLKIFKNILSNPNEEQYRDLNYNKVTIKFCKSKPCLDLLFCAGFELSIDQKRLKWKYNNRNFNALKTINDIITVNININIDNDHQFVPDTNFKKNKNEYKKIDEPLEEKKSISTEHEKCNISTCSSLKRIAKILRYYQINQFQMTSKKSLLYHYINDVVEDGNYSTCRFLNDFHHLLFVHKLQFEQIYNNLICKEVLGKKCDKSSCIMLSRNNRDRSQCDDNNSIRMDWFYGCDLSEEINIIQIIDRIHCYYLHSFDVGFKLTKLERDTIIENKQESELKSIHNAQQDKTLCSISKIIKSRTNKQTSIMKQKYNMKLQLYQFGILFIYSDWPEFQKLCDDIKCKTIPAVGRQSLIPKLPMKYAYKDLKEEMLFNTLITISSKQWNDVYNEALIHFFTDYCNSRKPEESKEKELKEGQLFIPTQIQKEHVISLILYCGFDHLSTALSKTYMFQSGNLLFDHQQVAHFGKYLKEACYYFGENIKGMSGFKNIPKDRETRYKQFYHGISDTFCFEYMLVNFCLPFSTSTDVAVAINFASNASNNGLILTLEPVKQCWIGFTKTRETGCDCVWISPYKNEQEVLFFGYAELRIINVLTTMGDNYELYITAINMLLCMMNNLWFDGYDEMFRILTGNQHPRKSTVPRMIKQIVVRMVWHELNTYDERYPAYEAIPKYIESIMHHICISQNSIKLNWDLINIDNKQDIFPRIGGQDDVNVVMNRVGFVFLRDIICTNNMSFINISAFALLLPNLKRIYVDMMSKDYETLKSSLVEEILSFIMKYNAFCKIDEIRLNCDISSSNIMDSLIDIYHPKFVQLNWTMWKENGKDLKNISLNFNKLNGM